MKVLTCWYSEKEDLLTNYRMLCNENKRLLETANEVIFDVTRLAGLSNSVTVAAGWAMPNPTTRAAQAP